MLGSRGDLVNTAGVPVNSGGGRLQSGCGQIGAEPVVRNTGFGCLTFVRLRTECCSAAVPMLSQATSVYAFVPNPGPSSKSISIASTFEFRVSVLTATSRNHS